MGFVKVNRPGVMGNAARVVRCLRGTSHKDVFKVRKPTYVNRNGFRDRRTLDVARRQSVSYMPLLVCLILLTMRAVVADVGSSMRRGNHLERKGEYEEAIKYYQEALVQEPDNAKIHYNIGRALYRLEKYDEAISEFQLGFLEKDRRFHADVLYNIANSQFKKGQLDPAIESYKMSLFADPDDIETKQNLEFCLKIKEQIQNQPQSDSTQQQQEQQPSQPQPRKGEIGKEEAERILQALQNEEKDNLEKARKPEKKEDVDKDW